MPPMTDSTTSEVTRTEVLRTLSLASDLGVGLSPQHGLRACYIALRIAEQLGLDFEDQKDIVDVALLKNAGCTSWTTQVAAMIRGDEIAARREMLYVREFGDMREVLSWAAKFVGAGAPLPGRVARLADFMVSGRDFMREGFESGAEVACRIGERLGASENARRGLQSLFEQWNGKGMPRGLRGEAIPLISRIVFVAGYVEVAFATEGVAAAKELAHERSGSAFDPRIVRAFASVSAGSGFWEPLQDGSFVAAIEAQMPGAAPENIEEFALCCADFVDMKAYWLAGHSRRVAALAERLARRLRFTEDRVRDVRLAGLVHDLGLVSVPSFILNKPADELAAAEQSAIEAHGEVLPSLFGRISGLRLIGEIARSHHERPAPGDTGDGADFVLAAALVSVANEFDELTHDAPGKPAIEADVALARVQALFAETGFAPAADALAAELGAQDEPKGGGGPPPGGLTAREVEVLGLLASGLSRKQIAARLGLRESTVRSHMEHIYSKLDVSTRVGAVLFAIEHGLVA